MNTNNIPPSHAEITRVAQALIPNAWDAAMTLNHARETFDNADAQANRDVDALYEAIGLKYAHPTTRTIAEYLTAMRVYARSLEALADAEERFQVETMDDRTADEFGLELCMARFAAGLPRYETVDGTQGACG